MTAPVVALALLAACLDFAAGADLGLRLGLSRGVIEALDTAAGVLSAAVVVLMRRRGGSS